MPTVKTTNVCVSPGAMLWGEFKKKGVSLSTKNPLLKVPTSFRKTTPIFELGVETVPEKESVVPGNPVC
jgi:hypothetical protein